MSQGPVGPEVRQQVRELMGRATLARVRGEQAQALKLAQEALVLQEANWEVHEFIGDVLMDLGRGGEALGSFRRAREMNPSRVELEDKVARAAVRRAAYQDQLAHMNALLEGRAPQEHVRKPAYAAVCSLLVPGLGQFYNGQLGKAFGILAAFLLFSLLSFYGAASGVAHGSGEVASSALSGAAVWLVLLVLLYAYAVIDGVVVAGRTMTKDRTGLV